MTEEEQEGGRIQWVPDPIQEVERLRTIVEDDIEDLEVAEQDFEETVDEEIGNQLLLYFALAHSSMERYSQNILSSLYNSEDYQLSGESIETLEENDSRGDYLRQRVREDLLYAEGIIDNGLKSQIVQTGRTRNELVHDPHERVSLSSIEDISSKVNLAYSAATGIEDIWKDELRRGDTEVIE